MGILNPQGGQMDPRTLSMLMTLLQQNHPGAGGAGGMPMQNAAPQIPGGGGGGGGGVPYAPTFPGAQNGAGGPGGAKGMASNLGPAALLKMIQQGGGGAMGGVPFSNWLTDKTGIGATGGAQLAQEGAIGGY